MQEPQRGLHGADQGLRHVGDGGLPGEGWVHATRRDGTAAHPTEVAHGLGANWKKCKRTALLSGCMG